jgi:hypothetical protein
MELGSVTLKINNQQSYVFSAWHRCAMLLGAGLRGAGRAHAAAGAAACAGPGADISVVMIFCAIAAVARRRAPSHAPSTYYSQRKSPAVKASEKLAWLNAIVGYCHVARVRAQGDGRNSEVGRKDGEQQFIFAEHCAARRAAQARLRVAGAR